MNQNVVRGLFVLSLCLSCDRTTVVDDPNIGASGGSGNNNETDGSGGKKGDNQPNDSSGGRSGAGGAINNMGGMGGEMSEMGGSGSGEGRTDIIPSAGCALEESEPPSLEGELGPIPVSLPTDYDGVHPQPLIIAFHAYGTTLLQLAETQGSRSVLADDYVIALPKNNSLAANFTWEGEEIEDFDAVYEELANKLCFDESRVFGVGNAGGGRFLANNACHPATTEQLRPSVFRAIALAGAMGSTCTPWPSVPLLFIHSEQDKIAQTVRDDANGHKALERFKTNLSCEDTSTFVSSTNYDGATYECSDFDDCSSKLRFCSHDVPVDLDLWQQPHNKEISAFFAHYL